MSALRSITMTSIPSTGLRRLVEFCYDYAFHNCFQGVVMLTKLNQLIHRKSFPPTIVLSVIGSLLLMVAVWFAWGDYQFIQHAARADGFVVRQAAGKHHVHVRFKTADGQEIDYPQNGLVSYEKDEKVVVLYDPSDPRATAETAAVGSVWAGALMLSILGFGVLFLAYLSRSNRDE